MSSSINVEVIRNDNTINVGINSNGPQGPRGPKGDIGLTGPRGPQGVQGIQGPQGIRGIQGPQGIQGYTGPKGDKGDRGSDGVVTLISTQYAFQVKEDGNLYVIYPDETNPPQYVINEQGYLVITV